MRPEDVTIAAFAERRCVMPQVPLIADGCCRARAEFGNGFLRLTRRQNLAHCRQAHDEPHGEQGKPGSQAFACGSGRVHLRMVTQAGALAVDVDAIGANASA